MVGSCLCVEIQFRLARNPLGLYQCHCSLCRKQSGAPASAATLVHKDHFSWQKGKELIHSYIKSTGFRSDFCSKCGAPVPNIVGKGQYMWVPAGALNTSEKFEIVAHLFMESKVAWESAPTHGEIFTTGPGIEALFKLLNEE